MTTSGNNILQILKKVKRGITQSLAPGYAFFFITANKPHSTPVYRIERVLTQLKDRATVEGRRCPSADPSGAGCGYTTQRLTFQVGRNPLKAENWGGGGGLITLRR